MGETCGAAGGQGRASEGYGHEGCATSRAGSRGEGVGRGAEAAADAAAGGGGAVGETWAPTSERGDLKYPVVSRYVFDSCVPNVIGGEGGSAASPRPAAPFLFPFTCLADDVDNDCDPGGGNRGGGGGGGSKGNGGRARINTPSHDELSEMSEHSHHDYQSLGDNTAKLASVDASGDNGHEGTGGAEEERRNYDRVRSDTVAYSDEDRPPPSTPKIPSIYVVPRGECPGAPMQASYSMKRVGCNSAVRSFPNRLIG